MASLVEQYGDPEDIRAYDALVSSWELEDQARIARVKQMLAESDGTRAYRIALLAGITREQLDAVGGVRETLYRHYKGGLYRFVGHATHSETGEKLVLYREGGGTKLWARPKDMFYGTVATEGGEELRRFSVVPERE